MRLPWTSTRLRSTELVCAIQVNSHCTIDPTFTSPQRNASLSHAEDMSSNEARVINLLIIGEVSLLPLRTTRLSTYDSQRVLRFYQDQVAAVEVRWRKNNKERRNAKDRDA
jgi:hypothetical protein